MSLVLLVKVDCCCNGIEIERSHVQTWVRVFVFSTSALITWAPAGSLPSSNSADELSKIETLKMRFQVCSDTPLPAKPGPGCTQLIDLAWDGTVYIEAEGTNEGLQDLQARCGNTISLASNASRATITGGTRTAKGKSVFRMIRGNSWPGELWLRCIREKERILN
ncbi:hypothetical protein BS47DRAFT_1358063 [Hydnum rufescens UP504]|uniref:Uncharacterized protein n=1 Tax=Hydnum rufescens UP504 TaxID=1448309 RepID=A0A9P6E271_9AGAM|nr:hypothetical protein BS47DRAFT_1358063 [Hydnum rufescens UP504]